MKWGKGEQFDLHRLLNAVMDLSLLDKATYATVALAFLYLAGHLVMWLLRSWG